MLTVKVLELDNDASLSVRRTSEAIYGLPQAEINSVPCSGTLSLSYKIRQPYDFEFLVSLCLVFAIIVISILASYVMTCTKENPRTGWLLMGIFVLLAVATFFLEYPAVTWEGDSRAEGPTFFYNNIVNIGIKKSLRKLEGGMYLSTVQNIIMIMGVKIFRLRENLFLFVGSMGILYLVLCLAPFCSHYFKKYFTRTFRFICSLVIICYSPINTEFNVIGYFGVSFLLLLLLYDFEKISNFVYAFILLMVPVVCTSKMMFVVFAPLMVINYLLFRREMNRKKKCCIAVIGISSFMEGFLSLILKHGTQAGHKLGTIQRMPFFTLINKVLYYTVQTFGILFRCGTSNANQLFQNVCVSILVTGILAFTIWQIARKAKYKGEAKFILVMFSFIVLQCSVILLTTTFWHADISWKQSVSILPGHFSYSFNVAAGSAFLTLLWIILQYFKPHLEYLQEHLDLTVCRMFQAITLLFVVGTMFLYINQHTNSKSYDSANPTRTEAADWRTYSSMLDSDTFCIRISPRGWDGNNGHYMKNASEKSVSILRSTFVDLSNIAELNERTAIVFYVHKTAATNQILDRYYYMNIFDKNGNFISRIRQINQDAERLYIGFYPEEGISNIGHVEFTHEDGSPAFVDDTIEIGYR